MHPHRSFAKRRVATLICALGIAGACVAIRCYWGAETASAQGRVAAAPAAARSPAASPAASSAAAAPSVVATVNGEQVSRQELAQECLRHHGKNVLETLLNKYLIVAECQQRNVAVTQEEVNGEIER